MTALFDAPPADSYDVVVAGSGVPALMAAAVAAERGLTVLVLERSGLLGGTSSISAGTAWVPCNPYQAGAGVTDDPAAALEYLVAVASGRGRASVLGALVDHGTSMLEFACLAPIDHAPFYGMPLQVGAFGTSGGVVTDDRARALDADGEVIAGLFAVGNVSAQPVCAGYSGAGGTLGPALTMAYLAGQSIGAGTAGRRVATSMARRQ